MERHLMIKDLPGLIGLVQMGTLEVHPWGCRADAVEQPDRMIFDLDPDATVPWSSLVEVAKTLQAFLLQRGLQSWVKTTGGKGLHVVVPLVRRHTWQEVKDFSHAVAQRFADVSPTRLTASMSKAQRKGKIFLDYLRNSRGATAVAAYSTRAREGAPVAVPISWDELNTVSQHVFTVEAVMERVATLREDPWKDLWHTRQSLSRAARRDLRLV